MKNIKTNKTLSFSSNSDHFHLAFVLLPPTMATFNIFDMVRNYFWLAFVLLGIESNFESALHNFKRKFGNSGLICYFSQSQISSL